MGPTCLARGEECRGTCGQPQRYSLHASPVQRSINPVTPSLTTKMLTEHTYRCCQTFASRLPSFGMSYVCSLGRALVGRQTEKKMKEAERHRNYMGGGGGRGLPLRLSRFPPNGCTCSTLSDIERILIKVLLSKPMMSRSAEQG